MKINKDRIAKAWREAANDLRIEVIAPFFIELDDNDECEFIGLIKAFGTEKGTLICLPEEWDDLGYMYLAEEHDYHCSGLYAVYEQYERGFFVETLNDWGWFGNKTEKPSWYKGPTDAV